MKEREINLIDLIFEILLRWRFIIAWMLVFGVLMGGFSYWRSYRSAKAYNRAQQENENIGEEAKDVLLLKEQLEEQLTDSQKMKVVSVIQNEQTYADRQAYLDHSVFINMDATAAPQMDIIYGIVADDSIQAGTIAYAYREFLMGSEMFAWLAEQMGNMTAAEVSELISVGIAAGSTTILDQQSIGQVVNVVVRGADKASCEKMAKLVMKYAEELNVKDVFGDYEMVLLNQSYAEIMYASLLDSQIAYRDKQIVLQQALAATKDGFTEEERQYYDLLKGKSNSDKEDDLKETTSVEPATARISAKYIILGLFMGAFLYAFFVFVVYLFGGKLQYEDDVLKLYEIPLLGQIPGKEKEKRWLGFVDRWLRFLKSRRKRQFPREDALHLAAVAVKMEAAKEGCKSVYCVGCELQQGADQVCRSIAEALKKENITVKSINNILYDAESREKLRDVKAVVLVEKAGVSMYQEIADEIELLKRQNITVLGSIVVE